MMGTEYEASLLALSPALEESRTVFEITEVASRFARTFGLDYIACLELSASLEKARSWSARVTISLSTFPADWLDRRPDVAIGDDEPVFAEARRAGKCFLWSEAWHRRRHQPLVEARIGQMRALGIADGFAAPMAVIGRRLPLVLMAGGNPSLGPSAQSALTLACSAIHRRLAALDGTRLRTEVRLTERERQCLSWAAAGKSDWEIGQIIDLSAKTVNYHIENAKRKSGVQTRVQAIVEAVRSGVIA
jgi:LuxR family quorum sensing-dependent transcriptional regulator